MNKKKVASAGTQTSAYKQSILDGLVTSYRLIEGKIFPWNMDDIDACREGLKKDLAKLVEECRCRELDLKINAVRREIEIIKKTNFQ